jgi:tetratricopeptide (TPR) repeat protein
MPEWTPFAAFIFVPSLSAQGILTGTLIIGWHSERVFSKLRESWLFCALSLCRVPSIQSRRAFEPEAVRISKLKSKPSELNKDSGGSKQLEQENSMTKTSRFIAVRALFLIGLVGTRTSFAQTIEVTKASQRCHPEHKVTGHLVQFAQIFGQRRKGSVLHILLFLFLPCVSSFAQALECFQKSLILSTELNDKPSSADALANIGHLYSVIGNYAQAFRSYNLAMEIVRPLDDRRRLQELLTGLGILYAEQGEFDKMSDCLDRSLKIAKELGDQTGVATMLVDLGIAEREQGHVDKALQNLIQSLTIAEQIKSTGLIIDSQTALGSIYRLQGQYERALEFLVAAITRTSTLICRVAPTRTISFSWRALSSLTWAWSGISPISSKKIVPPLAASKSPRLSQEAPSEGAFLVTEKNGFSESVGHCSAVEWHERSLRSPGILLNGAGYQFLARS